MKKQSLQNKIIAITGGSSGIGAAIGLEAAKRGAIPVLLARSTDRLQIVCDKIRKETNKQFHMYSLDVSDVRAIDSVFDRIVQDIGDIDVLVNNAGFGKAAYFHELDSAVTANMFQVNVLGVMSCSKKVLPAMLERHSGHIINVASIAGKVATPRSVVYAATKHAVLGFTNGLRMELVGTGVHVTAINPGPVRTAFFNIADLPEDYAKKVSRYMLEADVVAKKVVRAMEKPKREVNLPFLLNVGSRLYQTFPKVLEKVAGQVLDRK